MARRSSRARGWLWLLPLLAAGALLTGLFSFAEGLPQGADAPEARTDAIVVLTGGAGRIDRGLELLEAERAGRLFISGVYRGVEVDELLHLAQRSPEEMRCCIELGYEADDTQGNAQETAAWARAHKIASLRLVTAAYHLPRARLELARYLPEVEILVEPVAAGSWSGREWWRSYRSASLLGQEYLKYLAAWLRSRCDGVLRRLRERGSPA